jgi:hypothetical protein
MSHALAVTQAVAVEIRRTDSDAMMGVALIVPTERYVFLLSGDTGSISAPALSKDAWREVDAWDEEVAARLPFKPEPMYRTTVEALLGGAAASDVVARRFASIPITIESRDALTSLLKKMLPGLLHSRRQP